MKIFRRLNATEATLLVFIASVLIALPLMYLAAQVSQPAVFKYIEISALGWFAGGAIVGTYVYLKDK